MITTFLLLISVPTILGKNSLINADGKQSLESMNLRDILHLRLSRQTPSTCTGGYESVPNSVMCLTDSPDYIQGTAGISEADKEIILDKHNNYRAAVNPSASKMLKLYWDDELARVAEKWAKQCTSGHGDGRPISHKIPAYDVLSAQNAAFGSASWAAVVDAWHSEIQLFQYGEDPNVYIGENGWTKIGHYTIMVNDETFYVGCGYAECSPGNRKFYFCNYLPGYLDAEKKKKPYKSGNSCSGCTNSCPGGKLCDCSGTYCFNGGTFDMDSCQCSCKSPFTGQRCLIRACPSVECENGGTLNINDCSCTCPGVFFGDRCQEKNCTITDAFYCGNDWPESLCNAPGVPDMCPYMCKICLHV